MRYTIHFRSGNTLSVSEERLRQLFENKQIPLDQLLREDYPYIERQNIEYISAQQINDNAGSSVIRPMTPHDLKKQEEEARLKRIVNPKALIAGIRQKAEQDE